MNQMKQKCYKKRNHVIGSKSLALILKVETELNAVQVKSLHILAPALFPSNKETKQKFLKKK